MPEHKKRMASVGDVSVVLDTLAPPAMAQSWDNVGLLVGDRSARCGRILLCIDLTAAVLEEAVADKCTLIVAYHPPLFQPISRLLADSSDGDATVHDAVRAGLAIYSPHTALDAAPGGTNDVLAGLCDLTEIEPFEYVISESSQYKVVTFVPKAQLEKVALAMAAAGAGRIGEYELCSYRLEGEGTFFGKESAHPRMGRKGRLEKVAETRIEMVCPKGRLPEVVDALLRSHPYEEPAYDVYPLAGAPGFGIGRVGQLPAGTRLNKLAARLKKATGSTVLTMVGKPATWVRRAAICVGAAGRLPLEKPRSANCDVIITGEMRHHDALAILRRGKTGIAIGHWESERPVLRLLAKRIAQLVPGVVTRISRKDVGPFRHHF